MTDQEIKRSGSNAPAAALWCCKKNVPLKRDFFLQHTLCQDTRADRALIDTLKRETLPLTNNDLPGRKR